MDVENSIMDFLRQSLDNEESIRQGYVVYGDKSGASSLSCFYADGYTESGIAKLGIKANSIIEIKLRLTPDTVYNVNRKVMQTDFTGNVYIIYAQNNVYSGYVDKIRLYHFYVVSFDDLLLRANAVVQHAPIATLQDESFQNDAILIKAANDFKNGQNAFILGAGVSIDAKLPSWEQLLKDILQETNNRYIKKNNYTKLNDSFDRSSIVSAQFISNLEENSHQELNKIIKTILKRYYNPNVSSNLIKSIIEGIKTKNVCEILTYNYDDLIEAELDYTNISYYSVFGNNRDVRKYLPIYHLHGFLPITLDRESIFPTPILTEEEYHKLYKQPYHWSNVTLLHALNTKTCFFIGLSMKDPNLRRLIDYYRTEDYSGNILNNYKDFSHTHYLFLQKEKIFRNANKNEEYWKTLENMYSRCGIKIIWHIDHKELPKQLMKLYDD